MDSALGDSVFDTRLFICVQIVMKIPAAYVEQICFHQSISYD